jgi:primary-amine oxidase
MSVDGPQAGWDSPNTVFEVDTQSIPMGKEHDNNVLGNAFHAVASALKNEDPEASESGGERVVNSDKARYWKVVNPSCINAMGHPTAYKLAPGENGIPFAHADSAVMQRAGFMRKHIWVTPYAPKERFSAGEYPNQSMGGDGLPSWVKQQRDVQAKDLVLWYTFCHTHIPRCEDWPVMPTTYLGFHLKPLNFFNMNPSNDVPPSDSSKKCRHCN